MPHPDDFYQPLPSNRHEIVFDSIHDRCYQKNFQKAITYHRKMVPEARETDLGQVSEQLTKTTL